MIIEIKFKIDFEFLSKIKKMIKLDRETNYLLYSGAITCFSPLSNLYQVTKLHDLRFLHHLFLARQIFPQQMILRYSQLHISGFFKDHFSPWAAFGMIGILQGGIYGHANLHFANKLGISKELKYQYNQPYLKKLPGFRVDSFRNYFRGSFFGGPRDMISQGIPFLYSNHLEKYLKEINPSLKEYPQTTKWGSLLSLSILATYLSHPLHNGQVLRQTHPELNTIETIKKIYQKGYFFKGTESRVLLLFVTNIFNEIFLKPAWD